MDNYRLMMEDARRRFTQYDIDSLLEKNGVESDGECLYTQFLGQTVRIEKATGHITLDGREADFGESLSIYDWLCDRKPDAAASSEFCQVSSLSGVYVSGSGLSLSFDVLAKKIHHAPELFLDVCRRLGGEATELGDLGIRLNVFPDLPMCIKFYYGDEEFPPSLTLLWNSNILCFVRYETVYYIAGCLGKRLAGLMDAGW